MTRFSGSNSNIGIRKSAKPCASSGFHSYFSTRTSNNPHGFNFRIFRSSPETATDCFIHFTSLPDYFCPSEMDHPISSDYNQSATGLLLVTLIHISLNMSRCMGKPTICIGENKVAEQLRSNCEADQRLCFRYTDSTIPLLSKSKISSLLLS